MNWTSDLPNKRKEAQESWIVGISHDMRTPLTIILGYADSIETNILLPEEVQDKASHIEYQGIRLRNLVNDLNLITRLGDGLEPIRKEIIYADAFCREVVASFLNNGKSDHFSIEFTIDKISNERSLFGDRSLLERAIHNLIHNCMKHNPTGCNIAATVIENENIFHLLFLMMEKECQLMTLHF